LYKQLLHNRCTYSRSLRTIDSLRVAHAKCNAVSPDRSRAFTSTALESSTSTTSSFLERIATWSGELPPVFVWFTWAPWPIKRCASSALPSAEAIVRRVSPDGTGLLMYSFQWTHLDEDEWPRSLTHVIVLPITTQMSR